MDSSNRAAAVAIVPVLLMIVAATAVQSPYETAVALGVVAAVGAIIASIICGITAYSTREFRQHVKRSALVNGARDRRCSSAAMERIQVEARRRKSDTLEFDSDTPKFELFRRTVDIDIEVVGSLQTLFEVTGGGTPRPPCGSPPPPSSDDDEFGASSTSVKSNAGHVISLKDARNDIRDDLRSRGIDPSKLLVDEISIASCNSEYIIPQVIGFSPPGAGATKLRGCIPVVVCPGYNDTWGHRVLFNSALSRTPFKKKYPWYGSRPIGSVGVSDCTNEDHRDSDCRVVSPKSPLHEFLEMHAYRLDINPEDGACDDGTHLTGVAFEEIVHVLSAVMHDYLPQMSLDELDFTLSLPVWAVNAIRFINTKPVAREECKLCLTFRIAYFEPRPVGTGTDWVPPPIVCGGRDRSPSPPSPTSSSVPVSDDD
jgi:hypothetical protein